MVRMATISGNLFCWQAYSITLWTPPQVQEPAFVAKYAFQLAQAFNLFYHKHHILSEADPQKKAFLLLLSELVERQLVAALSLLGIEAPEKM